MSAPRACVLKTQGTNCDYEMSHAFEVGGSVPEIVHINELRNGNRQLNEFGILGIPGGFSYGDDVGSGRIMAIDLQSFLADQLRKFVEAEKPIIGICNGAQVLVKSGLLPSRQLGQQSLTLTNNEKGPFHCRWIDLSIGRSVCKYIKPEDFEEPIIPMQMAHAEGRTIGAMADIQKLIDSGQVVFRYAQRPGTEREDMPYNPNGSMDDIAGICDPDGIILAMMPHPERSIASMHPNRRLTPLARSAGTTIFKNIVNYAKQ